jgi:hypothetical protein
MARSQATHKGVKAENLMEVVEPEDFIFRVLHNQMGAFSKQVAGAPAFVSRKEH